MGASWQYFRKLKGGRSHRLMPTDIFSLNKRLKSWLPLTKVPHTFIRSRNKGQSVYEQTEWSCVPQSLTMRCWQTMRIYCMRMYLWHGARSLSNWSTALRLVQNFPAPPRSPCSCFLRCSSSRSPRRSFAALQGPWGRRSEFVFFLFPPSPWRPLKQNVWKKMQNLLYI